MAVQFNCPHCKANYEVANDLAGKMIMCRVCKKRGPVLSLSSAAASSLAMSSAAMASGSDSMSRRSFLPWAGLFVASLGAIGVGALLARQPWDQGKEEEWQKGRDRRRQQGDDQKDGKDGGKDGGKEGGKEGAT